MTDLTSAELVQLALHFTGNKAVGGKFYCSPEPADLSGGLQERLCTYYLEKFNNIPERYRLYHPASLQFNLAHHFISAAFAQPEAFHEISKEIA
ncbi:MAG: hypothetical protein JNM68_11760, partial [Dinghuibacter sp.]|nr:hypothetical protein [Dinghuibacter sp.]